MVVCVYLHPLFSSITVFPSNTSVTTGSGVNNLIYSPCAVFLSGGRLRAGTGRDHEEDGCRRGRGHLFQAFLDPDPVASHHAARPPQQQHQLPMQLHGPVKSRLSAQHISQLPVSTQTGWQYVHHSPYQGVGQNTKVHTASCSPYLGLTHRRCERCCLICPASSYTSLLIVGSIQNLVLPEFNCRWTLSNFSLSIQYIFSGMVSYLYFSHLV